MKVKRRIRQIVVGLTGFGEGLRATVGWVAELQESVTALQNLARLQVKAALIHQHELADLRERIRSLEAEKVERERELGIEPDEQHPTIN